MRRSVKAGRNTKDGLKQAAIEVVVPLGGRSMYGFLGGEFQPASPDRLHVSVCVASSRGKVFANNVAGAVDEARVGLPAEYSDAVFDGIPLAKAELTRLAAGRLLIKCRTCS